MKYLAISVPSKERGFTITELMIAVTIVAILTTIGAFAYGRLTKRSRINEAITFFASVAGAQETYYNMYGQYCETANSLSPNEDDYDPDKTEIRAGPTNWDAPDPRWRQCGVRLPSHTRFQYLMAAGSPALTCRNPPPMAREGGGTVTPPACESINAGTFWYYIVGRADQDGDGRMSCFGSSSTMSDTHWSIQGIELE